MMKTIGITTLCLIVLAGCGNQEEPAQTGNQTPTMENQPASTEPATERSVGEMAQAEAATQPQPAEETMMAETEEGRTEEPQGQMAQVAPTVPTKLGDPAYPLTGLTWVKGEPAAIKPGTVYVVEFWATWCPPCRTSIPHLTELQEKYKDRDVVFVGVSNENVPTVEPFVTDMGNKMDYRVAVDAAGAVVNGYMVAFGQDGIPTAFVVDAKGRVVWYGHPMADLDQVIGQVLAGTYEIPS